MGLKERVLDALLGPEQDLKRELRDAQEEIGAWKTSYEETLREMKQLRATVSKRAPVERQPLPAGRVSQDEAGTVFSNGNLVVQPPTDHESFWRALNLDVEHLDQFTPHELLDMLIDISPEISRAAWDFQRLCNPGYEVKTYELGSEDVESVAGKEHINGFLAHLRDLYGSVDVVVGRYFLNAYLRGAFTGELVLDGEARESVDLVAPDPYSIRFRKVQDPVRGPVWVPGQWQGTKFVELTVPTFRYVPVDPAPASPYGRPLAAPALFTGLFLLSLMHDVKRVIMQQGYKRMDIVLNMEMAKDAFEYSPQGYASLGEYVNAAIQSIRTAYAALEPDDAFIHTDIFELNVPAGTIDSDTINAIDKIFGRLEKMVTRALKSNGLVMGTETSASETDSNRRWEIHAAGIKSLQHHCENMLESLLTESLRAKGIQARVRWRFSELRAAEMFRDEQTRTLRINNSVAEREAGFISQDEASNKTVNHDAFSPTALSAPAAVEMVEDNNNGNEALNQGSDERGIAISAKPATLPLNGVVYEN